MVILVVSSMAILPTILNPFFNGMTGRNEDELLSQLDQYILLGTGTPSDWGCYRRSVANDFGLASSTLQPYDLDIDKVTRLNGESAFALTYNDLLESLKVANIAVRIQIQPLFETTISMSSSSNDGNATSYSFDITTQNSGLTIISDLSCYLIIKNYVSHTACSTDSHGDTLVNFTIPNSISGNALVTIFARARAEPTVGSFVVYSFGHEASIPHDEGTFMKLSPLNHVLNVSKSYADEQVSGAFAISYGYWGNMTLLSHLTQTAEYSIPNFCDNSITILVLTGLNHTESFSEWETYPQVPLTIGVNFDASTGASSVISNDYVVKIKSGLYRLRIQSRRVG
jgi:hypothetical protein